MDFFILFVIFVFLVILLVIIPHRQNEQAKAHLIKIVKQAGGKDIALEQQYKSGTKGTLFFNIVYVDINEERQTRIVTTYTNIMGFLTGEYYWDKPIQAPESPVDNTRSASKEQVISDMDAEIKRLQEELARVKKESE